MRLTCVDWHGDASAPWRGCSSRAMAHSSDGSWIHLGFCVAVLGARGLGLRAEQGGFPCCDTSRSSDAASRVSDCALGPVGPAPLVCPPVSFCLHRKADVPRSLAGSWTIWRDDWPGPVWLQSGWRVSDHVGIVVSTRHWHHWSMRQTSWKVPGHAATTCAAWRDHQSPDEPFGNRHGVPGITRSDDDWGLRSQCTSDRSKVSWCQTIWPIWADNWVDVRPICRLTTRVCCLANLRCGCCFGWQNIWLRLSIDLTDWIVPQVPTDSMRCRKSCEHKVHSVSAHALLGCVVAVR